MVIGNMMSDAMIKPYQDGGLFESPSDYSLDYEDVTFETSDGITLHGWLIPGDTDKVIIQSHFGVQANRCGWQRKGKGMFAMWHTNISFLKHVKYLHDSGYTVLMYDFRNHGESAKDNVMPWVSYGKRESIDVKAAISFIENHEIYADASIGLLSICMGASATVFAYNQEEEEVGSLTEKENIKGIVCIQPLAYKEFLQVMGVPKFVQDWTDNVNSQRLQCQMKDVSFMPFVKNITVPTLVIQNENDPFLNRDHVQQFFDDLQVDDKQLKWVSVEKSRFAGYNLLTKDPKHFAFWFDKFMKPEEEQEQEEQEEQEE